MRFYIVIIFVPLLCIIISLLQYLVQTTERSFSNKTFEPLFEDLLVTELTGPQIVTNPADNNHQNELSDSIFGNDLNVLNTLNAALQTQLTKQQQTSLVRDSYLLILMQQPQTQLEQCNSLNGSTEIQHTMDAALVLKRTGRADKALKIIEHAATIAPNNPDVLNQYGEILEVAHNDVIAADQMYFHALKYCPEHVAALANRQRTVHVVEQFDLEMLRSIEHKRDLLRSIPNSDPEFQKFKRQAYYLHIYHTVGIEGNTLSVEQLRYLLETGRAVFGKSIIEHNEILGLQLAMKYVKLLSRIERISVNEILGIHRRVMGHVNPLESGAFRETQVYVGSHTPPEPSRISQLMNEFVEWLNSEEALSMHPIRYAALAHYKLVDIHPFSDGNGRTSRLLMNLILIRSGYPPVIILKEHRHQYYDYLKIANRGDVRPFVRFIAQCTEQVLDLYLWGAQKFSVVANIEDFSVHTITL